MASTRGWLGVYLRGLCMGAADAVPGVSGGTIALITGIYERLVGAVTAVTPTRVGRVLRSPLPGHRGDGVAAFLEADGPFLLVLGAGILSAVLTVTRVVDAALESFPAPTYGFFFGLIGASAWVLREEVSLSTTRQRFVAAGGFVLAFVVSGRAGAALGHGPAATFIAGTLAVSAMLLPGLSGSLILVLLGQYKFMTDSLTRFVDGVVAGDLEALVAGPGVTVVTFVVGAAVGLLTVAHVVRAALARDRAATLAFLVALIVGALRAPVERTQAVTGGMTPATATAFAVAAVVGVVAVIAVERAAGGVTVRAR
ncbi:MAG: DUF368 domain-containing protein [Halolamina sp.]